jgi:hypothetical protein
MVLSITVFKGPIIYLFFFFTIIRDHLFIFYHIRV